MSRWARFHDKAYDSPECLFSMKGNDLWISIGASLLSVPPSPESSSISFAQPISQDEPAWYERATHWKAWIPITIPESWFGMDALMMAQDDNEGQNRIVDRFQRIIDEDVKAAHHLMLAFVARQQEDDYKKTPEPLPLPSAPDITRLGSTFNTRTELVQFLTEVQRAFVEILGAIRWLTAFDDEADNILTYVTGDVGFDAPMRLENWRVYQPGGRGVAIDLLRDWKEINISLYLEHTIPVHYIWSQTLHDDLRFRSLSPISMGASAGDVSAGSLPDWANCIPHPTEPDLTTYSSDQFLQLVHPKDIPIERLTQSVNGVKMANFVVDFEGWKARDVFEAEKHRYLGELWYIERIIERPHGRLESRRVFHRYRPTVDLWDRYNYINAPKQQAFAVTRELYKFSCCPPPFQRYIPPMSIDIEQVVGPTIPSDAPLIIPIPPEPSPIDLYTDDESSSVDDAKLNLVVQQQSVPEPAPAQQQPASPPATPIPASLSSASPIRQVRFDENRPPNESTTGPQFQRQDLQSLHRNDKSQEHNHLSRYFQRDPPPHIGKAWRASSNGTDGRQTTTRMGYQRPTRGARGSFEERHARGKFPAQQSGRGSTGRGWSSSSAWGPPPTRSGNHESSGGGWGSSSAWGPPPTDGSTDGGWGSSSAWGPPPTDGSTDGGWGSSSAWGPPPTNGSTGGGWGSSEKGAEVPIESRNQGSTGEVLVAPDSPRLEFPTSATSTRTCTAGNATLADKISSTGEVLVASDGPGLEFHTPATSTRTCTAGNAAHADNISSHVITTSTAVHALATTLPASAATTVPSPASPTPSPFTVRALLDTHLSMFVSTVPPVLPPVFLNWRDDFVNRGVLVVNPHQEARLRYRALLNPSWSIIEAISDAINRGIHFHIAIQRQDLQLFNTPREQLPNRPEFYKPAFRDRPLVYEDATQFCDIWEQEVRLIFARPHARIYLFCGDLLWRLAREFGPPQLFQAVTDGPSPSATAWGQYDEIQGSSLIIDGANKYELPILLGHAHRTQKYLWPPKDCVDDLICWAGEWDEEAEAWFRRRLYAIRAGADPMTQSDWEEQRHRRNNALHQKASFNSAFTLFSGSSEGSWNGKAIREISY